MKIQIILIFLLNYSICLSAQKYNTPTQKTPEKQIQTENKISLDFEIPLDQDFKTKLYRINLSDNYILELNDTETLSFIDIYGDLEIKSTSEGLSSILDKFGQFQSIILNQKKERIGYHKKYEDFHLIKVKGQIFKVTKTDENFKSILTELDNNYDSKKSVDKKIIVDLGFNNHTFEHNLNSISVRNLLLIIHTLKIDYIQKKINTEKKSMILSQYYLILYQIIHHFINCKQTSFMKNMLTIYFLFGFINSFSQTKNSILWKISGNNLKHPQYLFGTLEGTTPNNRKYIKKLNLALDDSKHIYFENNLEENIKDFKNREKMYYGGDSTLNFSLNKKENYVLLSKIESAVKVYKLKYDDINKYRPLGVFKAFVSLYDESKKGFSSKERILKYSIQHQIKISNLMSEREIETYELSNIESDEYYTQKLLISFSEKDKLKDLLNYNYKLRDYYKKNRIDKIKYEFYNFNPGSEPQKKATAKNILLSKRIISRFDVDSSLFAIDVNYLAGEDGIINILKNKGFLLTPVLK